MQRDLTSDSFNEKIELLMSDATYEHVDSDLTSEEIVRIKKIECKILDLQLEKWERSGVPNRHKKMREYRCESWLKWCDKAKERSGTGMILVLLGGRGVGKTQMSVEIIRHVCKQNQTAMYTKAIDIFLSLRESMRVTSENDALKKFLKPSLLVIDAMEERGETTWEDRLLSHIIDKRYDDCNDTIMISNQKKNVFLESCGSSIVSRIKETGGVVECDWESFR